MFLSGGIGFQSTQVHAKSSGCGGKTSTANVFNAPARAAFTDFQFMDAKGPGYLIRCGNLFAVEPDVGAEVDALELQPDVLAAITCGNPKLSSIPPGNAERDCPQASGDLRS